MEVFVAKVAVSPVSVQMHVQQGPWGAWPADWHRQPFFFFIHVYNTNTPECILVHMTAC